MPAGRPSGYTLDKANEICRLLITFDDEGKPHSLRKICEIVQISTTTLFEWLHGHPEFMELYTRSRKTQADLYADLRIEVAWENPQIEIPTKIGSYTATDSAGIARNRLRFDAMTKHAGQINPQKYGERVAHTGADGESRRISPPAPLAVRLALVYPASPSLSSYLVFGPFGCVGLWDGWGHEGAVGIRTPEPGNGRPMAG